MNRSDCNEARATGVGPGLILLACLAALAGSAFADDDTLAAGRRIYMDGVLTSGESLTAEVIRDVRVVGDQVICGKCHRRSGLGASEGQEVVPPVVGEILFNPLQLPTSKPPEPPVLRPAYTRESLAAAIRDGIGADGEPLDVLMPRYPLSDDDMEVLITYLESLDLEPDPGVTEEEIHFATIVTPDAPPEAAIAMLAVMETFIEQKNAETRHETQRASSGVWHKDWKFKPYRKWVLHTWELGGSPDAWPDQLQQHYAGQPVFAILNGVSGGSWRPIHEFCESNRIPCIFPTTDLPVVDPDGFYSMYLSKGVIVEAEAVAAQISAVGLRPDTIVQVFDPTDARSAAAADTFRIASDARIRDVSLGQLGDGWSDDAGALVLWLDDAALASVIAAWPSRPPASVWLSAALLGDTAKLDERIRPVARIASSIALAEERDVLLARSTGWLRLRRVLNSDWPVEQANAYFTLKTAGSSLVRIGGYFKREYFLENLEHMIDNASYTSVYPRMSLAPDQRFVSKGAVIAVIDENDPARLVPLTEWTVPGGT